MLNKLLGLNTIVGSGRDDDFLIFFTKIEENKFSSKEMIGSSVFSSVSQIRSDSSSTSFRTVLKPRLFSLDGTSCRQAKFQINQISEFFLETCDKNSRNTITLLLFIQGVLKYHIYHLKKFTVSSYVEIKCSRVTYFLITIVQENKVNALSFTIKL